MRAQSNYHIVEGGGKSHFRLAKPVSLLAALFFLFSIPITPVSAQDISSEISPETNTQPPKTEIIADEAAGTVSIVIDGKTVGLFTKDGLHVLGDIVYGGTITDTGADYIQRAIQDKQNDGGADEQ